MKKFLAIINIIVFCNPQFFCPAVAGVFGAVEYLSNFTMCFPVLVFNEEGILLRCPWKVDSVAPDTDSGSPVLAGREASAKLFGGPAGTLLRIMLF